MLSISLQYVSFSANSLGSSVEVLNSGNRSVATYGTLAEATDSHQCFITDLTQRKYFEGYKEMPGRRHDTIPWIVKKELGTEVSYVVNPVEETTFILPGAVIQTYAKL